VQIAVSRNDLECVPTNFKGLENVWKEEQYGLYKYYCGKISTFKEVEALKSTVLEHYPDAYVVAFEKDGKIDVNEAKKRAP
jgi:N-acetylmuramoyl-L-alanine amidase